MKVKREDVPKMSARGIIKLMTAIGYIGGFSWLVAWVILGLNVDFALYCALIFYGLGISGITILFTLLIVRRILEIKGGNQK